MSEKTMPPRTDEDVRSFLSLRKEAARCIDPATAEVISIYAQTMDPYGIDPDLPEELQCVGREYFARAPGSDLWVWFGDLPEATGLVLRERFDDAARHNKIPAAWEFRYTVLMLSILKEAPDLAAHILSDGITVDEAIATIEERLRNDFPTPPPRMEITNWHAWLIDVAIPHLQRCTSQRLAHALAPYFSDIWEAARAALNPGDVALLDEAIEHQRLVGGPQETQRVATLADLIESVNRAVRGAR